MRQDGPMADAHTPDSPAGHVAPLLRHSCEHCGRDLAGKQERWCSDACRFRAWDREHPRQRALPLSPPPAPVPPVRDQRVGVADRKRLVGHNLAILERLKAGPATNAELATLLGPASAWRTRCSDVRIWAERHLYMTVKAQQIDGGLWLYSLEAIQ